MIEVYIAHGCTKVYTYYNPKPTISSVENDEIHEDNDVVTSTYTQNVLKMLFFDMFPHHVDTSVDTQRFAKRLFLDTVPHVETQVVEDSWRVEHSYDDVASTDKIDDDSYVYERSGEDEDSESQKDVFIDEDTDIDEFKLDVNLFVMNATDQKNARVLIGNVPDFMFDENDLDVIDNEDFDSDSGEGCDMENIRRQSFGSSKQIKDRVNMYSIETIKKLKLIRNDKRRVRAKYVGLMPVFDVNDNGLENMGIQLRDIKTCNYKFLLQQIIDQVSIDLRIPTRAVQDTLQKKCELNVSHIKALRAEEMVDMLIKVEYPEDHNAPTRVFKYVCLGALKQGFKATG
ncbi:hypothetical protein Tco_0511172, partial [Tanacetum coccineum]